MELVTGLVEAILATGPLTALPPDKGQPQGLYLDGAMCDVFSPDEVNAITGGTYGPLDFPPEADDPNCTYEDPTGFVIAVLSNDFGSTVDTGTYTSEDLTVADRPAIWEPDREFLTVDAGDDRTLAVGFSSNEPDPAARRDQAIALAEALIPKLSTVAPPTPVAAECTASLDELSRITGPGDRRRHPRSGRSASTRRPLAHAAGRARRRSSRGMTRHGAGGGCSSRSSVEPTPTGRRRARSTRQPTAPEERLGRRRPRRTARWRRPGPRRRGRRPARRQRPDRGRDRGRALPHLDDVTPGRSRRPSTGTHS